MGNGVNVLPFLCYTQSNLIHVPLDCFFVLDGYFLFVSRSTLSLQEPLSYRNQSSKSMYWFLYDNGPRHEKVKNLN